MLGQPGQGVTQVVRIEHTPGAVTALLERIAPLEPDPAEVRVVLETRHGVLAEQLLDAGFTVLPVNPALVARRRAIARDDSRAAQPGPLLNRLRQDLITTVPVTILLTARDLQFGGARGSSAPKALSPQRVAWPDPLAQGVQGQCYWPARPPCERRRRPSAMVSHSMAPKIATPRGTCTLTCWRKPITN